MEHKNPRDQQNDPIKPKFILNKPIQSTKSLGNDSFPPNSITRGQITIKESVRENGLKGRTVYFLDEDNKLTEGKVIDYFFSIQTHYVCDKTVTFLIERNNKLELIDSDKISLVKIGKD